ncbi:hypothetical protein HME9302_00410 [Alteripontixanthobacter maritimus]|uniref:SPOR domain-containing protein n=1 Tax=Alteripontixanthobacter maritimus TaxID=2161824 RepID=A0A369Q380_9SPHN|nr:SPOR domain-containing protein [Alteripontixanthobacter maritimus]RDC59224.1 hypothetical protein HME9302_00410 [Alteripontixanthobacter maritimus]
MNRQPHSSSKSRMIALVASTALASIALAGCATKAAPRADLSASKAQQALAKGKSEKALEFAEAAVLAEPRNAAYRTMLGAVYMDQGRFVSAAQTFDDAMALGDTTSRTALSFALASIAAGQNAAAIAVLDDWSEQIAPADLGLAYALAGNPDRGVHILGNAIRQQSDAKTRQNLAYAYALQGNWRGARIMAAEDVAGDKLDARIAEWAHQAHPDKSRERVAALLSVPIAADSGQPAQLALANNPGLEQMVAQAAATLPEQASASVMAPPEGGELPPTAAMNAPALPPLRAMPVAKAAPVATATPDTARPATFRDAFKAPAPTGRNFVEVAAAAADFVSKPVVQAMPVRYGAAPKPARKRTASRAIPASASGTHLVQLGSFRSEQGAKRAWGIYTARDASLANYEMVITKARVRGKTYYRVNAGGLAPRAAASMCSSVKAKGHGCITWAEGKPLPGAIDTGIRVAKR